MVTAVDLGRWTVDELRAAGFDEVGVVQPLLHDAPLADGEPLRRDLEARGALVLRDGRWLPRGDLGVLLVTRARARLTAVVRGPVETLLLGLFAGGDGLLQVDRDGDGCSCRLRTRAAVVDELAARVLDGVPDRADGPLVTPGVPEWEPEAAAVDAAPARLVVEALRADDPQVPPVQVQLTVAGGADGARVVWGLRNGERAGLAVRVASHGGVHAALRAVLVGETA